MSECFINQQMFTLQCIHSLVGILLLDCVTSLSYEKTLSILDKTLTEEDSTKCDLAILGGNKILAEEHNGRAIIPQDTRAINKDKLINSACLIMICNEKKPFREMVDLVAKFQMIKPVGVLYEVKDWNNVSKSIKGKSPPFPIILLEIGKKTNKHTLLM